jgi:hypothetical protein
LLCPRIVENLDLRVFSGVLWQLTALPVVRMFWSSRVLGSITGRRANDQNDLSFVIRWAQSTDLICATSFALATFVLSPDQNGIGLDPPSEI